MWSAPLLENVCAPHAKCPQKKFQWAGWTNTLRKKSRRKAGGERERGKRAIHKPSPLSIIIACFLSLSLPLSVSVWGHKTCRASIWILLRLGGFLKFAYACTQSFPLIGLLHFLFFYLCCSLSAAASSSSTFLFATRFHFVCSSCCCCF